MLLFDRVVVYYTDLCIVVYVSSVYPTKVSNSAVICKDSFMTGPRVRGRPTATVARNPSPNGANYLNFRTCMAH